MKKLIGFLMGAFALAPLGSATPDQVVLKSVSALGSGCLPDRTATTFSLDGEALTLVFDELFTEAYSFDAPDYNRVFCRINLRVSVPEGWSFGIFSWDTRGYVDLFEGASATISSGFSFGRSRYEFATTEFYGP
ncbi:MAG: DUF4360 domain-containing protein [Pseudobacteriovorax sp.]|nr:DUF4360 domain-containing protein [Pseudobacteriovorax sp.]